LIAMDLRTDRTSNICDTLFGRLSARGLMSVEILRLIKDVLNIVGNGGNFTVASINKELGRLGWRERVMDEISFELITFILENEYDYEVKRILLH
jgi:hypothetical protein